MNDMGWTWNEIARAWTRNPTDRERQACWHLLSLLDDRIADAFIGDARPTGLDTEALLAIRWSETEREIAKAAASLYNSSGDVNLGRVARRFSGPQLEQLEEALAIYRASWTHPGGGPRRSLLSASGRTLHERVNRTAPWATYPPGGDGAARAHPLRL